MEYELEKRSDKFWYYDPSILWNQTRFIEFFPNPTLSFPEKLNALVRLSFYISIILMIFFGNYLYIYIPIVVLAFTFLIYKNYFPKVQEGLQDYKDLLNSITPQESYEEKSDDEPVLQTDLEKFSISRTDCT